MSLALTRRGLVLAAIASLSACATSPPTRLHLLAVEPAGPLPGAPGSGLVLGVGPIEVVDYLERPEIVTRRGRTSLVLAEFDRWGERFEVMVARVLRESLARLLATDAVLDLPADRDIEPDFRLALQLLRFEAEEEGEVVLEARWELAGRTGSRPLRRQRTVIREPIEPGPGIEPVVAAMSRALGALAGELARAVAAQAAGGRWAKASAKLLANTSSVCWRSRVAAQSVSRRSTAAASSLPANA